MKMFKPLTATLFIIVTVVNAGYSQAKSQANISALGDLSKYRGFNYTPAGAVPPNDEVDQWVKYSESVTNYDLDLAKRLNLNQVRVFVPYEAYLAIKDTLKVRLRRFAQACHIRGIGVMVVVGNGPWAKDTSLRPRAIEWVKFLSSTLSSRPGLAMWDIMNEPDYPEKPLERVQRNFENCKFMSQLFREIDPKTPITIGMAFEKNMEELANYVDVLEFHDYSDTREKIEQNILRAKQFAVKVGKPVIDGEIGCIARANPYDVTLEEHMKAHIGWYIWELMIVRKGWGVVHGVFYEDGTVRDPSIAAAILGFFRNRNDILPAVVDREGAITRVIDDGNRWLTQQDANWNKGLNIAETAANLLEAGELAPMHVPPTWEVRQLRRGQPDVHALQKLIQKYLEELAPFKRPAAK